MLPSRYRNGQKKNENQYKTKANNTAKLKTTKKNQQKQYFQKRPIIVLYTAKAKLNKVKQQIK